MLADPEVTTGGLTAAEAAARSAVVEVHGYRVELDLTGLALGDMFCSRTVIEFSYRRAGGPGMTWVDLVADQVTAVVLDGVVLDPAEVVRGNRVRLGPLGGPHRVEVVARHRTGVPGRGLSRSVDSADGGVYVWTQFQPFDARRMFACFDQPDLKATFEFSVRLPLEWQCVSGRLESSVVEDGDAAVWEFPPTPVLPTYATAVCAGPFAVVSSDSAEVPMSLYARRSLTGALERNAPEIFGLSARGLELFAEAFGRPYDGDSYDHVFLPDQAGAMENHGCVTWNDEVVYRSEPTIDQRRRRSVVLLHELSHMWFGNLVTPQWWDGLWLSESFADWAAVWAAAELGVLDSKWSVAIALEKERATGADLLSSTHPVSRPVADLAAAEANFDMITYAKGACMLRQLVGLVGEPAFLAGLRSYFEEHAGGNGSLATLLDAIPMELSAWSREWLETSGINTLSLEVAVEDGCYKSAVLVQGSMVRRHDLSIGIYRGSCAGRVDVRVAGERTDVPELVGEPVAELLLLDEGDTAYAVLRPDERSVRTLLAGELTDPVARAVARRTVHGLLRDGLLPAGDVVDYLTRAIGCESDPAHLRALATLGVEAAGPYAQLAERSSLQGQLATACVAALESSTAGADDWLVLVDALADFADSPEQLALSESLLVNGELPQPTRWRLLTRLVALGAAGPDDIGREQGQDADPDSHWQAATAQAALPTPTAKDTALDLLLTSPGVPASVLRTFGPALWQPRHEVLLADRPSQYLDRLPAFGHDAGWPAAHRAAFYAFPTVGLDNTFINRLRALTTSPELPPVLRKTLQDQAETHLTPARNQAPGTT